MTFDDAVQELFQAPHAAFVTERKRLAGELKEAGDKAGSTKLGKINRPPISAWAVNQLWWQERDAFDNLLSTAERLREGDLGGTAAHREALTTLRAKASAILTAAEHAATESTLRRIQTTLSAIACAWSFVSIENSGTRRIKSGLVNMDMVNSLPGCSVFCDRFRQTPKERGLRVSV